MRMSFEYDHQTSPLSSNRELLEQAMESSFFDLLPYFETISLLKKKEISQIFGSNSISISRPLPSN